MNKQNLSARLDQAIRAFTYGLIFLLPISIALAETFIGFIVFFYLLKKLFASAKVHWQTILPKENPLNVPIVTFLGFCLFSILIISPYPALSFRGLLGKELAWALVIFAIIDVFKSEAHVRNLIIAFVSGAGLNVFSGYIQHLTGMDFLRGRLITGNEYVGLRVSSSWKHANLFAGYLVIVIPYLLGYSIMMFNRIRMKKYQRYLPFVFFGLVLVCFGLTYSRSAWLAIMVALLFWGFLYKRSYIISAGIICVFLLVFLPKLTEVRNVTLFSDNLDAFQSITGGGRLDLWKEAVGLIREHPFFGIGLNCYARIGSMYPHNSFLQLTAELGILGLGIYLWILAQVFISGFKAVKSAKNEFIFMTVIGTMAGLVGIYAQSFIDTQLYSSQLRTLIGIMIGLLVVIQQKMVYR